MIPERQALLAEHLRVPGGWLSPGLLRVDAAGMITEVGGALVPGEPHTLVPGLVVPGLPNLHSHAFQRALAGLTEHTTRGREDSFWTWRTAMYTLASQLTPDELEAIAAQLYVELLESGMTAVGEFHYLHHDRGGARFDAPEELSARVAAAAGEAGIALTLLPVLYLHGGFGQPALERQRRFTHSSVSEYFSLWDRCARLLRGSPTSRLGVAPHSLRAVAPEELEELLGGLAERDPRAPIHIHAAEQLREVEECSAHLGARPVRWLLDQAGAGERWCLVHATHLDPTELRELAASGAIAGLCPTTEANLGDGRFPATEHRALGGKLGVGSDSHISTSLTEELRWLEYGERLTHLRRNMILGPGGPGDTVHVGAELHAHAARYGAEALDQPAGSIAPGRRADLVVLDPDHPRLAGHGPETALDAWIFGGADLAVRDVYVAGERVVEHGRHRKRDEIRARFVAVMRRITHRGA